VDRVSKTVTHVVQAPHAPFPTTREKRTDCRLLPMPEDEKWKPKVEIGGSSSSSFLRSAFVDAASRKFSSSGTAADTTYYS